MPMRTLSAIFILAGVLIGCRKEAPAESQGRTGRPVCPGQNGTPEYYFGGSGEAGRWALLVGPLAAIGAPSWSCGPLGDSVAYRLTYVPAMSPPAFVVTIAREGESWNADWTMFRSRHSARPYDPYEEERSGHARVPAEEARALERALERAKFFELPRDGGLFGEDAHGVAIESVSSQGYHVVMRWVIRDEPFFRTAYMFFELAGLPYPEGPLPWER